VAESPERVIVVDNPALTRQAADWIVGRLSDAVRSRGRASLALAGGSTPRPIYADLAGRPKGSIAWDKVDIFFGDERAVPPEDADSNYRMAREALLSVAPIPKQNVHRMEAERADRDRAADEYAKALPSALDVLILGMGPDGHTASLFPGGASLKETRRLVLPVTGTKPPPQRLTITPPVIAQARGVLVVATGKDKATMVAKVLESAPSPSETPIVLAKRGTWMIDTAAASALRKAS
jgi:6-phosphogluconolactonase